MTMPPELHPNEPLRLDALRALNVMDTPLEERFDRITRLARRMLGVDIVAISLVEANRQFFKSVDGVDLTETSRDISFCGHAILQDGLFEVPDARLDPRFEGSPMVTGIPNVVFYAAHPLRSVDGYNIGTLCAIEHEPRTLSEDDRRCLADLAALAQSELQAASANALYAELIEDMNAEQRRSLVDSLTRVWNRDGILQLAGQSLTLSASGSRGCALIVMDLNTFKQINDTHGHDMGDSVLRVTAKRLLGAIRETDHVGRLGGDEFLIVLPTCESEADAVQTAKRVSDRLSGERTRVGEFETTLTASFGVIYLEPGTHIPIEHAIRAADQAMYEAKRSGSTRVMTAPHPEPKPIDNTPARRKPKAA